MKMSVEDPVWYDGGNAPSSSLIPGMSIPPVTESSLEELDLWDRMSSSAYCVSVSWSLSNPQHQRLSESLSVSKGYVHWIVKNVYGAINTTPEIFSTQRRISLSSAVPLFTDEANKIVSFEREKTRFLEGIIKRFNIRSATAVLKYLETHLKLLPVLKKLPEMATRYFESVSEIALDLRPDVDGSGPPELFVYIVTGHSAREAWERLREMEESWWYDVVGNETVNLHVEFI